MRRGWSVSRVGTKLLSVRFLADVPDWSVIRRRLQSTAVALLLLLGIIIFVGWIFPDVKTHERREGRKPLRVWCKSSWAAVQQVPANSTWNQNHCGSRDAKGLRAREGPKLGIFNQQAMIWVCWKFFESVRLLVWVRFWSCIEFWSKIWYGNFCTGFRNSSTHANAHTQLEIFATQWNNSLHTTKHRTHTTTFLLDVWKLRTTKILHNRKARSDLSDGFWLSVHLCLWQCSLRGKLLSQKSLAKAEWNRESFDLPFAHKKYNKKKKEKL